MKIPYLAILACLIHPLLPVVTAYGEGALPSDIITQAIKEDRTILQIQGTPVTDRTLERWCLFFKESERRKLNFSTARVIRVLRKGRSAEFREGQSLLISETSSFTYSELTQHNGGKIDDEQPISSAAAIEEGEQYLYIIDQVQTVRKKRKKEKASFSVVRDLDRKGIFKITSGDKTREMVPTITTEELTELVSLMAPSGGVQAKQVEPSGKISQTTKLGALVARKLAQTESKGVGAVGSLKARVSPAIQP